MSNTILTVSSLTRVLGGSDAEARTIIDGVSLDVPRGQFVALTGSSGSGKSTLLYLLGALDRPTGGDIFVEGQNLSSMDEDERAVFRNERLGFVFQFHFLLAEFSVIENVSIPMMQRGDLHPDEIQRRAEEALDLLGLYDLRFRRPSQLSGGQQQRVSIARAIANDPLILLADEPTGNLDSKNAELVFDIFARLSREQHRTIVMVTHDNDFAARADRQIRLRDGRIVEDTLQALSA